MGLDGLFVFLYLFDDCVVDVCLQLCQLVVKRLFLLNSELLEHLGKPSFIWLFCIRATRYGFLLIIIPYSGLYWLWYERGRWCAGSGNDGVRLIAFITIFN
jgi:hypothetical protein